MVILRSIAGAVLAAVLAVAPQQKPAPATPPPPPLSANELIDRSYKAAYNLDYDEAAVLARKATAVAPNESRTHRVLASVLWMKMLFMRGALTIDHYMGSVSKSKASWPKVPVDLDVEFQVEMTRATDLAEARLKAAPTDLDAMHDVGAAAAIRASYTTSIEGSVMASYSSAKRAFQIEGDVFDRDPSRSSAAFVVGIYRYVVSTFSMPTRFLAYLAGFGGGKEKGISLLETASRGGESHVEACLALMLIYTREGRAKDAVAMSRRLLAEFPRNRIFVLEEGSADNRAGFSAEADAVLTEGISGLQRDTRPRFLGEEALWFYKRAIARTQLGHLDAAIADLRTATAAKPLPWVLGRIRLQSGRISDLNGQRPTAVNEYKEAQRICLAENDPICADEASRLIQRPFTGK